MSDVEVRERRGRRAIQPGAKLLRSRGNLVAPYARDLRRGIHRDERAVCRELRIARSPQEWTVLAGSDVPEDDRSVTPALREARSVGRERNRERNCGKAKHSSPR